MSTELLPARLDPGHAPLPAPHGAPRAAPLPAAVDVDLVGAFLAGRRPTTLRAYAQDLADLARFLGAPSAGSAVEVLLGLGPGGANAAALAWRADMIGRGLAPATQARRLAALRSLVKLARTLGRVTWRLEVESPRPEAYRDTISCGSPGWRAMLERARREAEGGRPKPLRDLALVRCLHDLGLRRGEAVGADLDDLDLEAGKLAVLGKGRSARVALTLPGPTAAALARWVAARGESPGPLFTPLDPGADPAGRLTGESVRRLVAALARRAGVKGPVRPHGLRHIAVTEVLDRNGGDIRAAGEFARHADPKTTMRYDRNRRDLAGQMARLIAED